MPQTLKFPLLLLLISFSVIAQPSYSGTSNQLSNVAFTERDLQYVFSAQSNTLSNLSFELGYWGKSNILSNVHILPNFYLSKSKLDFGKVELGGQAWQGLYLGNQGADKITVRKLELLDDADSELSLRHKSLPLSLKQGDSLYISVKLAAHKVGFKHSKLRVISSGDTLSATIIRQVVGAAQAKLETRALSFGAVPLGGKATKTVAIKNIGAADLLVDTLMLVGEAGAYFRILNAGSLPSFPRTLKTGASFDLELEFTARHLGARIGAVKFSKTQNHFMLLGGTGIPNIVALAKPAPPTLTLIASNGVRVKWAKVAGALNYKLFRLSNLDGKTFSRQIYRSTVPAYTDRGNHLVGGKTYSYRVQAENGSGSSALSDAVAITLPTAEVIAANPDTVKSAAVGLWLPYVKPERKRWTEGATEKLNLKIHNRGNKDAAAFQVQFYLSEDAAITGSDMPLGALQNFGGQKQGVTVSKTLSFTVPALAAGSYYIGAIIDPDNRNALNQNISLSKFKVELVAKAATAALPDLKFDGATF